GFAYAHVGSCDVISNEDWPGKKASEPTKRRKKQKPVLPSNFTSERAITDYL
ncbi:12885_t:CDS:2, partial [Gigaspora rosea]